MGKIYERNPDTGEIRERPEDFGTGKMIPTYNPDAPWIDERVNENKSGDLLNEDTDEEDRQLSIPFK